MADAANGGMELDPKYDHYDYPIVSPNPQSGHPGHLTAQQQAQVHQLRLMLEAEGFTKRLDTLTLVGCLAACEAREAREAANTRRKDESTDGFCAAPVPARAQV